MKCMTVCHQYLHNSRHVGAQPFEIPCIDRPDNCGLLSWGVSDGFIRSSQGPRFWNLCLLNHITANVHHYSILQQQPHLSVYPGSYILWHRVPSIEFLQFIDCARMTELTDLWTVFHAPTSIAASYSDKVANIASSVPSHPLSYCLPVTLTLG